MIKCNQRDVNEICTHFHVINCSQSSQQGVAVLAMKHAMKYKQMLSFVCTKQNCVHFIFNTNPKGKLLSKTKSFTEIPTVQLYKEQS